MATCPECEFDDIDTADHEEGDTLSCPECGKNLVLLGEVDDGREQGMGLERVSAEEIVALIKGEQGDEAAPAADGGDSSKPNWNFDD